MSRHKKKRHKPQTAPALSPELEDRVSSLLADIEALDPAKPAEQLGPPGAARAFVERFPLDNPRAVDLLAAIRDAYPEKEVQKAVRKAFFRLKQRGVAVPEAQTGEEPPVLARREAEEEPSAYLSHVDGTGNRGVFIALPLPKGVDVGMGVINDEQGLVQFLYGRYGKKRAREVQELFFSNFSATVEVSLSHAATALEHSYGRNKEELNELTRDYLEMRPWLLEKAPLRDKAAVYDLVPEEEVPKEPPTESQIQRLLEHEVMSSWIVDPEKLKTLVEEIAEVKESPILVSELQQKERVSELKRKAVSDIFPEDKRILLKGRLEETAYVLFKLGDEDIARIALAAAGSVAEKESILEVNPFLEAMLENSLALYEELGGAGPEEEEDSGSLIYRP